MKMSSVKNKIFIIAAGLALILSLNFFQKDVKGFFYFISSPIQKILWQLGGSIFELKNLSQDNKALNLKIQELISENANLQSLKQENEKLRQALGLGLQKDFRLELAQIIGKDIGQDIILINKGSKDGLSDNLPVITKEKVLVGKTAEVYDKFSKVILISNSSSIFDAKIANSDMAGVIKGKGGSKIYLDLLPQDAQLQKDQVVVSSVFGGIFPPNLLVGKVAEFKKNDLKAFQQAEVKPFINFTDFNDVFVILEF